MPSDLTGAREALAAAHKMVADLCKRQGEPGWRRWEMSIPARPDHDHDLVIGAALDAGDALLAEVARLRAEKAPPEPPATTTHSAEDQGWTRSKVTVLAPRATAQDAAADDQDPEALRAAIRALTQEVKHLRAELVRVQGEVLDVDWRSCGSRG